MAAKSPVSSEMSSRARAFSVEALLYDSQSRTQHPDIRSSPSPDSPEIESKEGSFSSLSSPKQETLAAPSTPTPSESSASIEEQSSGEIKVDGVVVQLCSRDLWQQFYQLGTEMIITKAGRRMFPSLKVRVSGLDPEAYYSVWLDIVPVDDKRYRYVYHSSQWMVAGSGDPPLPHNVYIHPDNPALGKTWVNQGALSFDRLKLTNNRRPLVRGQVSLHSMHKYQPRIHIQKVNLGQKHLELDPDKALTFAFPETVFTTVTAYQNQQITRLKIASNPFAKGFREAAKTRETNDETSSLPYPPTNFQLLDQSNGSCSSSGNSEGNNSAIYPMYLSASRLLGPSLFPVHTFPSNFNCLPNPRDGESSVWMMPWASDNRNTSGFWQLPKSLTHKTVHPFVNLGSSMMLSNQGCSSNLNENGTSTNWCSSMRNKDSEDTFSHNKPVGNGMTLDHCWVPSEMDHDQWKRILPDVT